MQQFYNGIEWHWTLALLTSSSHLCLADKHSPGTLLCRFTPALTLDTLLTFERVWRYPPLHLRHRALEDIQERAGASGRRRGLVRDWRQQRRAAVGRFVRAGRAQAGDGRADVAQTSTGRRGERAANLQHAPTTPPHFQATPTAKLTRRPTPRTHEALPHLSPAAPLKEDPLGRRRAQLELAGWDAWGGGRAEDVCTVRSGVS